MNLENLHLKKIIKSIGKSQAVLILGDLEENIINEIKDDNSIHKIEKNNFNLSDLEDNSFTRIVVDYSYITSKSDFYNEIKRLLLPTGLLIIHANCKIGFFEKLFSKIKENNHQFLVKPKDLQNEIFDNGFLIDGYYGYPKGHLVMIALIQNKKVSTLFNSEKQETIITS